MYLTSEKVVNALVCAQEVLSDPIIFAGDVGLLPISIDTLQDYIVTQTSYAVQIRDVSFEGRHIFGRCEKYDDGRAEIDIRRNLPDDWKRFVTTKELLHLIIDGDEDQSPYGDQILDKLVQDGHIGIISSDGDAPAEQSELIAEVAAIELLYPIQRRLVDAEKLKEKSVTQRKLALDHGIPVNFVETAFSSDYLGVIVQAFEEMNSN